MASARFGFDIRTRLFLVSVLLIVVVGALTSVWLQASLRDLLEQRIEDELRRQARSAQIALEGSDPAPVAAVIDPLADRLGAGGEVRITVIGEDGLVLGDSRVELSTLPTLENHADRPEVVKARRTGKPAVARRESATLGQEMIYVAVPWHSDHGSGVVRAALGLDEVEAVIGRFRLVILFAAALGLVVAVVMSGLASHLMSRDVRALLQRIREVVERASPAADPTPHATSELAGLAGSVQELADRLETAVTDLAREQARRDALLESMSEAVLALDEDTRVTLANAAVMRLLGLRERPEGRLLLEVVRAPELRDVARAALDGDEEEAADEVELPGGQTVLATARPLRDREGCVLVLHDMTGVRRLERVRRDFVANVSHELRTPVSIIRANAESLSDGAMEEPEIAKRFLEAIVRNSERLSALIGDLLDLSRLESGRVRMEIGTVDVGLVAARAAESVAPRAAQHDHHIRLDVVPDTQVRADARYLEHILLNLLENAVKYTQDGGHIELITVPGPDGVRIVVNDDGPGIPASHRTRVFERFYRVDAGRAREQGGTGLGLAIVKHLAEQMGGEVGVDPRSPRGSSFWVRLSRPSAHPSEGEE